MVNDRSTEVLPEVFGVRTMPKKRRCNTVSGWSSLKEQFVFMSLEFHHVVIGGIIFVNHFKGYLLHLIHNEAFMKNHADFLPVNVIYKLIHCVL